MEAYFERFTIAMTLDDALSASHPGPCDADVRELAERLADQLDKIDPDLIRDELAEHGAWNELELSDDQANRERIVWIAASDIREEQEQDHD